MAIDVDADTLIDINTYIVINIDVHIYKACVCMCTHHIYIYTPPLPHPPLLQAFFMRFHLYGNSDISLFTLIHRGKLSSYSAIPTAP